MIAVPGWSSHTTWHGRATGRHGRREEVYARWAELSSPLQLESLRRSLEALLGRLENDRHPG